MTMEVQFTEQIEQLQLGAGATFHGEGILAITKALLQSGVAYIGGYQGAPVSHLLDVMVQAQVLTLLESLGRELGLAMLLITHDLSVLADACRRIAVMYAGRVVEEGPSEQLMRDPKHPYTAALAAAFVTYVSS